jgi:hypothetical protein
MKKIDLGQTVAILANVGVLIGILLLVYELYQNRLMMRAQVRSGISDTLVELLSEQSRDSAFMEISRKARAGEALTELEAEQWVVLQQALWRYRENVSYQYRNGLFDEGEYLAQREAWRDILNSNDLIRSIWCGRTDRQSPEFVAEINGLLDRPCE